MTCHDARELFSALVDAALTGHFCVSQMRANDAVDAVMRFADLCSDPARAVPALVGVVSQRLVRRVCEDCQELDDPPPEERAKLGLSAEQTGLLRGSGCERCRGTGYRGRLGLFQVLAPDDALRRLVLGGADQSRLRDHLLTRGWRSLVRDGQDKAAGGVTSTREVLRVTGDLIPGEGR